MKASIETREKLSKAHMGHKQTPETREKIRQASKEMWAKRKAGKQVKEE